jgi:hypothetical protein
MFFFIFILFFGFQFILCIASSGVEGYHRKVRVLNIANTARWTKNNNHSINSEVELDVYHDQIFKISLLAIHKIN